MPTSLDGTARDDARWRTLKAQLPKALTLADAIEAAYGEDLDAVSEKLRRGASVLVECDKQLVTFFYSALRRRLKIDGGPCDEDMPNNKVAEVVNEALIKNVKIPGDPMHFHMGKVHIDKILMHPGTFGVVNLQRTGLGHAVVAEPHVEVDRWGFRRYRRRRRFFRRFRDVNRLPFAPIRSNRGWKQFGCGDSPQEPPEEARANHNRQGANDTK